MSSPVRLFASYHLWSLIAPASGQQRCHCQMKRGFIKARQDEPKVKALLKAKVTPSQRIGLLAQKGIYEFHHNRNLLKSDDGVEKVAGLLKLGNLADEIQQRVREILKKYQDAPLLLNKRIMLLTRGDEGFPKPIVIEQENYRFRLYASMDCVLNESDNTLHIIDFKTGKSPFDRRQALVYLLAAHYLYPKYQAIASFYNLEMGKKSHVITVSNSELRLIEFHLGYIAEKHQQDLQQYHQNQKSFSKIFPPNPGYHCRFCPFQSICDFSAAGEES
ncbi:MAG: PD-(D/E)XK nuclease family protein [Richelia sp. RM2_1_2]|nr:PD-(D/E)XK nuclease family protein [Rivularia sp. T60_A2020_040]NJM18562.1 PD-(D/E)XK nuclease family protein [Richelia sp. SM1_7_0]NJN07360.1 PD-(D/E)XK nuclease family protein [Richelia sp. RM1_1_1]NJO29711.1 PD-(D/E)XK nuclease family protein [Richelia sp. SL_2_1]NJO58239.1 PD-(D/E)XK nuclease family protein [Richelia sp. RM2_1_2]